MTGAMAHQSGSVEGQSVRGSPSSNPVGANDASALVPQLLFPPCNPSHQSHALTPVRSGRSGHLSPQTSNALVSHRPPLCSSRSVASVQHLLTPLALEAALEGADLNSVCYTAMGSTRESMSLRAVCDSEEAHRGHVLRSQDRERGRMVRAFMAMKERAQFLAEEWELELQRQHSSRSTISHMSIMGNPRARRQSSARIVMGQQEKFLREEEERAAKRTEEWIAGHPGKEAAFRQNIEANESKQAQRLCAFFEERIAPYVNQWAQVSAALCEEESAARSELQRSESPLCATVMAQQAAELSVVGLIEGECICRGDITAEEEGAIIATRDRFGKGLRALYKVFGSRLQECENTEGTQREQNAALWTQEFTECHDRCSLVLSEHNAFAELCRAHCTEAGVLALVHEECVARQTLVTSEDDASVRSYGDFALQLLQLTEDGARCHVVAAAFGGLVFQHEQHLRTVLAHSQCRGLFSHFVDFEMGTRSALDRLEADNWSALAESQRRELCLVSQQQEHQQQRVHLNSEEAAAREHLTIEEDFAWVQRGPLAWGQDVQEPCARAALAHGWACVQQQLGLSAQECLGRLGIAQAGLFEPQFRFVQQQLQLINSALQPPVKILDGEIAARQILAQAFMEGKERVRRRLQVAGVTCVQRHVRMALAQQHRARKALARVQLLELQREEMLCRKSLCEQCDGGHETLRASETDSMAAAQHLMTAREAEFKNGIASLQDAECDDRQQLVHMGAQAWMDLVEAEYSGRARVTQMLRDVALANATIAVQRVWRGQFATSQVKQMKHARQLQFQREEAEQLQLWATLRLQALARMWAAQAAVRLLRQQAQEERLALEAMEREREEREWRARMEQEGIQRLNDEEDNGRVIAQNLEFEEMQRLMAEYKSQGDVATVQSTECRERKALLALETREWGVLQHVLHMSRQKIWNTANELKEHQQHIRVFECAEREGRRAILTAQSAEQRTLAADFLAFFVTSLNQQEEVHRQFLMGEEQLGWDIVRNNAEQEYQQAVSCMFSRHRKTIEDTERVWRHQLMNAQQAEIEHIRVNQEVVHAQIRVTFMEARAGGKLASRNLLPFPAKAAFGKPLNMDPLAPKQHLLSHSVARRMSTEAWGSPVSAHSAHSGAGKTLGAADALPDLFASVLLKKEHNARAQLVHTEEQMRESLFWSIQQSHRPPADFQPRGLSAPGFSRQLAASVGDVPHIIRPSSHDPPRKENLAQSLTLRHQRFSNEDLLLVPRSFGGPAASKASKLRPIGKGFDRAAPAAPVPMRSSLDLPSDVNIGPGWAQPSPGWL